MLGVRDLVALGLPGERAFGRVRVEHTPAGIDALVARIAGIEADPAEVRVRWRPATGCWSSAWSTPATW